jgi:hypothetical protein
VYEGEGIGVILGARLISNKWNIWSAYFYVDNHASITTTQLTKQNPGHYIFDALHKNIASIQRKHTGIKTTIKWVPGHKGVEGNEQADEEAKKAITEGSSDTHDLPKLLRKTLPYSKSTIKWSHNEKLKRHVQKGWKASKGYNSQIHQSCHKAAKEVGQHPRTT